MCQLSEHGTWLISENQKDWPIKDEQQIEVYNQIVWFSE